MGILTKVGLFFGGKSVEHEVSVRSIKSIYESLDRTLFAPVLFPVSKDGKIYQAYSIKIFDQATSVDDVIDRLEACSLDSLTVMDLHCVFSTMHGGQGENGAYQGFFEVLNIPYVGPSVLGSSIAMDKDVTKRLLKEGGLNVTPSASLRRAQICLETLASQGFPCFVKAASLGSSVGVFKCYNLEEAIDAAHKVFELDRKLLIEKAIAGREIEVSVIGYENKQASICGEVVPHHDFYSYQAKYLDDNGASYAIPADSIDHEKFKKLALQVCEILEIDGMARVDFFVFDHDNYYVNEVNTLPGFTSISMYPKLLEASGIDYTSLITQLIRDAVQRFDKNSQIQKTLYDNLRV